MAVVPIRPRVSIIEPRGFFGGLGLARSAEIEEEPASDESLITSEETPDGGIVITIGGVVEENNAAEPGSDNRFDRNLAESMDDAELSMLAGYLLESIDADIASRRDWEETANLAPKFLGTTLDKMAEEVSSDGTISKAVATAMLEAVIKIWSTHRSELLPTSGPVKVRRDNPPDPRAGHNGGPPLDDATGIAAGMMAPPPEDGDDLALAFEIDFNHYLTSTDREYYPDSSRMLFHRALIGNAFKKVFRDPLKRRPVSVWVKAQDLIVSNDCAHLSGAGRITERIRMRQGTMRRMQVGGHYRDIPLGLPSGQATETEMAVAEAEGVAASPTMPEDYEYTVYECSSELGSSTAMGWSGRLSILDRDERGKRPGFPLPYRVSLDMDSREILEIRRAWKQGDPDYERRRRYVKYGFIPGLGFYDLGMIHIVGNPTQSVTMIQRACTDAAVLGNFPAWLRLKGPGSRQQNTVLRPGPGEVIDIDAAGSQRIQDAFMPMPYKPPSAEAMALAAKLEGDIRRLAGIIELPVGEGRIGNTPVGTMMAYIEAVTQVPGAIAKDDHISQQEEFELLRELFIEDPESLTKGVKHPARRWQIAQELMDQELVPSSDPNTPSIVSRLMKVQGMVTMGGMPQFAGIANNREIFRHAMRILAGDDPDSFELPEAAASGPPPPDPKIVAAQIKAQADIAKVQAGAQRDAAENRADMAEILATSAQKAEDRASEERRALLAVEAARIKAEAASRENQADRVSDALQNDADRMRAHAEHRDKMAAEAAKRLDSFAPQEF
jgi:hypothetical protein